MYIDRNLQRYVVLESMTIHESLKLLNERKGRIMVVVNERDIVKGVATNGDVLRWISEVENPDLLLPVIDLINTKFRFVKESDSRDKYQSLLDEVLFLPIVNSNNQLVGVARRDFPDDGFEIGNRGIGKNHPCFIIAEIGNNHNGSMENAYRLVDQAIGAGVDCVKFQMRDMGTLYLSSGEESENSENLGTEYTLDLLSKFQLTNDQLFELFDYCAGNDVIPLCTPWDEASANTLEQYGMLAYKVASADLTNHDLLKYLAETKKPLVCSTGMSTENEIVESHNLLKDHGVPHAVLHCNSTYPTALSDVNLNYIDRLKQFVDCPVGYSGHERGIHASIAAVAKGAKIIERHITLDKGMEGNDHKASLLAGEFAQMVQGIREVEESLGTSSPRQLSQGEMINRVNLAKSLVINQDLKKGQIIMGDMIETKSPGKGLQPNFKSILIGSEAKRDFKKFDFFYPSDVEQEAVEKRNYNFDIPWGIPVRYHDLVEIVKGTNLDLVEFHFSYKDLNQRPSDHLREKLDIGFVVHSPELFAGDHILDLTSPDDDYRRQSVEELRRVITITRELNQYFSNENSPLIVVNVGGFSTKGFLSPEVKQERLEILSKSLSEINQDGVELIPQTMPPFPWHFGGQQFHNLFVDPLEIKQFCESEGYRVCLDVSHSKLACSQNNWSFYKFLEDILPLTAHMHFADSLSTSGEGLQIGEGEIDFNAVFKAIKDNGYHGSFIPEVWQGHENRGEGFWIALQRLEKIYNEVK